jgi:hypothetical protein
MNSLYKYNKIWCSLQKIWCFLQVITTKYGVLCKNKHMLWFYAKQAPTHGVMCYFLTCI